MGFTLRYIGGLVFFAAVIAGLDGLTFWLLPR